MTKECTRCGETKPITEFGRKKGGASGVRARCKPCHVADYGDYRIRNIEKIRAHKREYDKEHPEVYAEAQKRYRIAHPGARAASQAKYAASHKEMVAAGQLRYARAHPGRMRCYDTVFRAKRAGVLVAQACEECGETDKVHAHHKDYDKPLDVRWLCQKCHRKEHGHLRAEKIA